MITAGQRVQVIKRDPATGRGVLQFGTELVVGGDGSIAGPARRLPRRLDGGRRRCSTCSSGPSPTGSPPGGRR